MSVKIEFFGDDWAAIAAQMKAALGGVVFSELPPGKIETVEELVAPAAKATRGPNKAKPEPSPERTADLIAKGENVLAAAQNKDGPQEGTADETKPEGLNYETDIKPLVLEIAGRFGRDKVMEVLAKYGVTNAGHVPVEDQPALMEDIRLVLES